MTLAHWSGVLTSGAGSPWHDEHRETKTPRPPFRSDTLVPGQRDAAQLASRASGSATVPAQAPTRSAAKTAHEAPGPPVLNLKIIFNNEAVRLRAAGCPVKPLAGIA